MKRKNTNKKIFMGNNDINQSPSLEDLLGGSLEDSKIKENKKKSSSQETKSKNTSNLSLEDLLSNDEENHSSISIKNNNTKENKSEKNKEDINIFHKTFNEDSINDEDLLYKIENYDNNEYDNNEGKKHLHIENNDEEKIEDPLLLLKEKEEEIFRKKEKKFRSFLIISQTSIVFSIILLIGSFFLFSFLLDTPSKGLLGRFVSSNYGTNLEEKKEELESLEKEKKDLEKNIDKSKKIIAGFENNEILNAIIDDRIDWIGVIRKINEVRCYADPDSDISLCMKDLLNDSTAFNPFSFENYTTKGEMKNGKIDIIISGKVHGSQGYIFQKISRLINAFNENKHFSGAEMRRFSKTQDSRLGYYMPFTIKLTYYKNGKNYEDNEENNKLQ